MLLYLAYYFLIRSFFDLYFNTNLSLNRFNGGWLL